MTWRKMWEWRYNSTYSASVLQWKITVSVTCRRFYTWRKRYSFNQVWRYVFVRAGVDSLEKRDCSWNVMAHGDAREEMWRGNWRMQWVSSTLHTTSEHGVASITTADAHTSAASNRLNWRLPADLNGLVHFAERRNLVSACVPSHFKRILTSVHIHINTISFSMTHLIWTCSI